MVNIVILNLQNRHSRKVRVQNPFRAFSIYLASIGFFLSIFHIQNPVKAQEGTEWINFSNEYYKFGLDRDGIYKITYNDLQAAGFPIASTPLANYRLWHRGRELPVYVQGNGNDQLEAGEALYFVGRRNDGELDSLFYRNSAREQPHQFKSFYTDSSYYFLEAANRSGRRYQTQAYDPSGSPRRLNKHRKEVFEVFAEDYHDGGLGASLAQSSYITSGESFSTFFIRQGRSRTANLATPDRLQNGSPAVFRSYVTGRFNDVDSNGVNPRFNQNVRIEFDGARSLVPVDDLFKGFKRRRYQTEIQSQDLAAGNNRVTLTCVPYGEDISSIVRWLYTSLTYDARFVPDSRGLLMAELPSSFERRKIVAHGFPNGDIGENITILAPGLGIKAEGQWRQDSLDVILPVSPAQSQIAFQRTSTIPSADFVGKARMNDIAQRLSNAPDYLILSHPRLRSGAEEYAAYWRTQGRKVATVYTPDLYDTYFYGQHSALALKRFGQHLDQLALLPEDVLLLGKGLSIDEIQLRGNKNQDLVPTYGFPPSDQLLFEGTGQLIDLPFGIGRVPASNNNQVRAYLNKLQRYRNTGPGDWRKRILHLSGGRDAAENRQYTQYLNAMAKVAKGPLLGAQVSTFNKSSVLNEDQNLTERVGNDINEGINLLTYFGHGATETLEIDLGSPLNYSNQDRLAHFYFTGCLLGNVFAVPSKSLAEQFLFSDAACVTWNSGSGFGLENYLFSFSRSFYNQLFRASFDEDYSTALQRTIRNYQNRGDTANLMQCVQNIYIGDPAVQLYSPELPDYRVASDLGFLAPEQVSAESDTFQLGLIIPNDGRAVEDSLRIEVTHRTSSQNLGSYSALVPAPLLRDTVFIDIQPPQDANLSEPNLFEVQIDPDNAISERNEANNNFTFRFFLASRNVRALLPRNYSIVSEQRLALQAQANVLPSETGNLRFEIDTVPAFNSPWKKSTAGQDITTTNIGKWTVDLLNRPQVQDYYWRVKPVEGGDDSWSQSSFTYIPDGPEGWTQRDFYQKRDADYRQMFVNEANRKVEFGRVASEWQYDVRSGGQNNDGRGKSGIYVDFWQATFGFTRNGLQVLAVNPNTLERFKYESDYNRPQGGPNTEKPIDNPAAFNEFSGVFRFNRIGDGDTIDPEVFDDFLAHLDRIPEGYYVFINARGNHQIPVMGQRLYDALAPFGAKVLPDVQNGWPYALIGRKGAPNDNLIREATADTTSSLDPLNQSVRLSTNLFPNVDNGKISSRLIGPARAWTQARIQPVEYDPAIDSFSVRIYGLNADGQPTSLIDAQDSLFDISQINATQYPFLQLEYEVFDEAELTPLPLRYWQVAYDPMPDLTLRPDSLFTFYRDTLQQGDSLRFATALSNLGPGVFDSTQAQFLLFDADRKLVSRRVVPVDSLNQNASRVVETQFSTQSLSGDYQLQFFVNPENQPLEPVFSNNLMLLNFLVKKDETAPVLDVTFDGRRIFDGEIVSPTPEVTITVRDENPFLALDDPEAFVVGLQRPGQTDFEPIDVNGGSLNFNPATNSAKNASLIWIPDRLGDGNYKLRVSATDASGNPSDDEFYEVGFEVINESTITHFYPYPNPFSDQTRFVFTLTGENLPDFIKVQIMTVSGKVVREITQDELGPLNIGTNMSEYAWDGTDQFGNPLGNGLYFYKVMVYHDGERVELRETEGDQFFERGIGKMYLAR